MKNFFIELYNTGMGQIILLLFIVLLITMGTGYIHDSIVDDYGSLFEITSFFLILIFVIIIFTLYKSKSDIRYLIAWLSIFGGLMLLNIGYSIMPGQKLARAEEYQYSFFNRSNYEYLLAHLPKDDLYSKRVDRLNRDLKIQELKLEIEELKCYGPEEFFRTPKFNGEYIFFFLIVLAMVSYGIGLIVYLIRFNE